MTEDTSLEEIHRKMGPHWFNHTWTLLDTEERTPEQDDEMLAATFAQRAHWYEVGTERNKAIADWQVSRVAAVLGEGMLAERFGRRSLDRCELHDLDPFVSGYAHEALARAADILDDTTVRDIHVLAGRELAAQIDDPEGRIMLEADLAMIEVG